VGVDLGTTFSVVAVNKHGVVHVINDTITGDPLVPSIVAYLPDNGKASSSSSSHVQFFPSDNVSFFTASHLQSY